MDFDFTPEQEAFRKEVRQWLETNLPDDLRGRLRSAIMSKCHQHKKTQEKI